jgi:hypothetical protein
MQRLEALEEAKALLLEARDWGVWKWLTEKTRVRAAADAAWAALEDVEKQAKGSWAEDLRKAYRELQAADSVDGNAKGRQLYGKAKQEAKDVDPDLKLFAGKLKRADDEAFAARMAAEETFDVAERRMSVPLARRGSEEAIEAYELREKFIRRAEAAARRH